MVCSTSFQPPRLLSYICDVLSWCFLLKDTLVLEPLDPVVVLPSETRVDVTVEVVTASGAAAVYSVDVPKGSSLLEALDLLKGKDLGFM